MITSLLNSIRRPAAVAGLVLAGAFCGSHSAQAYVYSLDDGSSENSVGLTDGGSVIALNQFTVAPGSSTITSISAAFGTPTFPGAGPALGTPFTVLLYSDPNGDGVPDDAVLLASATGSVTSVDGDMFVSVPITPTTVTGSDFFIGYEIATPAGVYPDALDQTTDAGRSFVVGDSGSDPVDLNNLDDNDIPPTSLDDVGLGGNWLLRANSDLVPEPSTYAMMSIGGIALVAMIRLRRRTA